MEYSKVWSKLKQLRKFKSLCFKMAFVCDFGGIYYHNVDIYVNICLNMVKNAGFMGFFGSGIAHNRNFLSGTLRNAYLPLTNA